MRFYNGHPRPLYWVETAPVREEEYRLHVNPIRMMRADLLPARYSPRVVNARCNVHFLFRRPLPESHWEAHLGPNIFFAHDVLFAQSKWQAPTTKKATSHVALVNART